MVRADDDRQNASRLGDGYGLDATSAPCRARSLPAKLSLCDRIALHLVVSLAP
jgi:hypothetical protein